MGQYPQHGSGKLRTISSFYRCILRQIPFHWFFNIIQKMKSAKKEDMISDNQVKKIVRSFSFKNSTQFIFISEILSD